MQHEQLTETIIGCAFNVHNTLDFGFLESVYQKALLIELAKHNVNAEDKQPVTVNYDSQSVGEFEVDVLVEKRIILELKSVQKLAIAHEVQLVNYLTATGIDIGLLINFGPSVEVKRKSRLPKKIFRQDSQD